MAKKTKKVEAKKIPLNPLEMGENMANKLSKKFAWGIESDEEKEKKA